jgi:hypothetical protein
MTKAIMRGHYTTDLDRIITNANSQLLRHGRLVVELMLTMGKANGRERNFD